MLMFGRSFALLSDQDFSEASMPVGFKKAVGFLDHEAVIAVAGSNIDCSAGVYFGVTISANTSLTFSNPPPVGRVYRFGLIVKHNSGVFTLPSTVVYSDNIAPNFIAGKVHLLEFLTQDAGATWRYAGLPNYSR